MNQIFLIGLLAIICCNKVCSSPVNDQKQLSDAELHEGKPPKISAVSADNSTTKPSYIAVDHEAPVISKIHENTTGHQNVIDNKNATISPTDSKINSQPASNKNSNQVSDIKNETASGSTPVSEKSSSVISPANPIISTAPAVTPITITDINNTTPTIPIAQTAPTTPSVGTIKSSSVKPTDTTPAQESVTTTGIKAEHNTPALTEGSHFDGPSFIGGIVLTIGLTAIGFIAFKYYKSGRIDMNYRTL